MKVTVITGSPHKKGTSALLADEFIRGAQDAGWETYRFNAAFEEVAPCLGCDRCGIGAAPCVQKDAMHQLMPELLDSQAVALVTPLYYFGFSAQIKTVIDRFYANSYKLTGNKKVFLLATAYDQNDWTMEALTVHYRTLARYMQWKNSGMVLAVGCGARSDIERSRFPNVTWNKAANGYRLPTEAEWEYAVRANTTTPFSFGDYVHNSDANCYNANGFGLYNIHGNAAEWVWDWYGAYETGGSNDPTGPESGNAKIVRGGGWNDHPKHIRSAYRGAHPADVSLYSIGVRPVRNAEASTGQVRSVYSAKTEQGTGKTLIVYFSQTGNTKGLADLIHELSGADIFRLERATPYASSSNGPVLYGEALNELRSEAVPELKKYPNIGQYDTILLGYCNWWSSVPACVRTFLTRNDLSGKTIVPFCSMGGGHFGQTISAIAKLAPNSVLKEGLEVTYSSYDQAEIQAWLNNSAQ